MSPAIRLLAFLVVVAVVSAVAALAGSALGPRIEGSEPAPHEQQDSADHSRRSR